MKNKLGGFLNILKDIDRSLAEKINLFPNKLINKSEIEVVIISGDNVDKIKENVDNLGGRYEDLGYGYGIVNIPVDKLRDLESIRAIQYIELPKTLYTSDYESNRAICVQQAQSTFDTSGEGVAVGFIDTGIDYMHPAFRNLDGTTRVDYIWDLSLGGKVFDKTKINEAISKDDSSIVPSFDLIGHGTHVAGIACAGGNIPVNQYGVASKSSIMMVKATRGKFTISTQIMRGIKFLIDKSKELDKPLVINISLSTNDGAHNGSSLLEKYISTVCDLERVTIVIAAGNEGSAAHHVGGILRNSQNIDINVASDEKSIELELYQEVLPNLSIQITAPTGKKSDVIILKTGLNEGVVDGNRIIVYVSGPKPFDLVGEIIISIVSKGEYLTEGTWKLTLNVINEYKGNYDIWLPISEGLNKNTKFLAPTIENTLGIPATVSNVISVGSYNSITNSISPFSGRGSIFRGVKKPDIIAPGENISSTIPDRSFDSKTGTSMAAPHITGVSALLMEWGIVKGNDKFLFGERLKHYLVKGAKRNRRDEIYPNIIWGYGTACAYDSFELLREDLNLPQNSMRSDERLRKIIEYAGDISVVTEKYPEIKIYDLDEKIAVLDYPDSLDIEKIQAEFKNRIVYVENSPVYTLNEISPVEASGAYLFNNNPYLNLNGRGVLVGIIDTGIDYLSSEFMREDDTTRIESIWDQSVEDPNNKNSQMFGAVYSKEDINEAIKLKSSGGDPYQKVNSKDFIGHGTAVAGIIGARGINKEIAGAAPDSDFIIVKLKEASKRYQEDFGLDSVGEGRYENTDILLGIRYIFEEIRRLKRPAIIYVPLGTNIGSHDGSAMIERYIDELSKIRGLAIVTCVGNEGDSATHTKGILENTSDNKTIELSVGKGQRNLNFEIWFRKPDKVSLSIISPSGEIIEKIPAKLKQTEEVRFIFEGTTMNISYLIPEEITGDEVIKIKIKNLKEGIWQFRLFGDYIVDGRYDSWIPQRNLLDSETKFLNPSQYNTIQIPATARKTLVAAYYNQNNNATVGQSGRGYTRDGRVKPDIAAGGINAKVLAPGGGVNVASGSSIGGAVFAGCAALLMQWGIVEDNDPNMYSTKLNTYMIRGARMREGDMYPNREWGYGMLDMKGIFDNIRASTSRNNSEYKVGNLFIRKPL